MPTEERILIGSYWLVSVVIGAVYVGNLTAALAVSRVNLPFTTLAELAAQDEHVLLQHTGNIKIDVFRV